MRFLRILFYGSLILIGIGVYAARKYDKDSVKGNGNVTKEMQTFEAFDGLRVSGAFEVVLNQGDTYAVELEADENLHSNIRYEVSGGILEIKTEGNISRFEKMKVFVTAPAFKTIKTSGGVEISTENTLTGESLELEASGASKADLDVMVQNLRTEFSGAGDVTLSGEAGKTAVILSGAGKLKAFDLKTHEMNVSISGAGYAEVNADQKLELNVSGAGKVRYKGNPAVVNENISGAGSVDAEE
ncbi:MAG: head GIN domain-containing protein [Bacteroidia bacterium]|nr:head GIN domain-containing protein [Bacteroidia bacterium]